MRGACLDHKPLTSPHLPKPLKRIFIATKFCNKLSALGFSLGELFNHRGELRIWKQDLCLWVSVIKHENANE